MRDAAFKYHAKSAEGSVPLLAAVAVSAPVFFKGFDSAVGQSLFCIISSIILLALLWIKRFSGAIVNEVKLPLIFFAGGLIWLLIVHLLRQYLFPEQSDLPLAPDMFLAKYLSIVGGLWMFLIGILAGSLERLRGVMIGWLLSLLTVHCIAGMTFGFMPQTDIVGPMVKNGRFIGLVGNANVTASLAGAAVILAIGEIFNLFPAGQERSTSWRRRICTAIYALALVINGAMLLLTASRFSALVSVLGLILLLWSQRRVSRIFLKRMMPLVLSVMAVLVLLQVLFSGLLFERFSDLPLQAVQRGKLWMHFLDIAMVAPFTGYGPGAFPSVNSFFLRTSPEEGIWRINSPHNIFLQLWLVGGLPYLGCMLAGTVLFIRFMYQKRAIDMDARRSAIIVASIIIYLCGLIDIVLDVPASTGLAMFLTGFSVNIRKSDLLKLNIKSKSYGSSRRR